MVEAARPVDTLVGVGSEAVALGLNQVGAGGGGAEGVQVGDGRGQRGHGEAALHAGGYGLAQASLVFADFGLEEGVKHQVSGPGIPGVGGGDVA